MDIKLQPKILIDCRHYPGGITMASLSTIRGYTQYLSSGKYTNSSSLLHSNGEQIVKIRAGQLQTA